MQEHMGYEPSFSVKQGMHDSMWQVYIYMPKEQNPEAEEVVLVLTH